MSITRDQAVLAIISAAWLQSSSYEEAAEQAFNGAEALLAEQARREQAAKESKEKAEAEAEAGDWHVWAMGDPILVISQAVTNPDCYIYQGYVTREWVWRGGETLDVPQGAIVHKGPPTVEQASELLKASGVKL